MNTIYGLLYYITYWHKVDHNPKNNFSDVPLKGDLAAIFREARERAGLTQSELAERVGLAPNHVLRLEGREKINPRFETVARIAVELGLSLDELAAASGYRGTVKLAPSDAAVIIQLLAKLRAVLTGLEGLEDEIHAAVGTFERLVGTPAPRGRARRRGP